MQLSRFITFLVAPHNADRAAASPPACASASQQHFTNTEVGDQEAAKAQQVPAPEDHTTQLRTRGASARADELEARGTVRACALAGSSGATCGATCLQRELRSCPCTVTRGPAVRPRR